MTKQLIESTMSFVGDKSATWMSDTATAPTRWILWQGMKIKLLPIVSPFVAYNVTIGYIQKPAALVNPTDVVDSRIPPEHNEYLKYAAAAYLFQLDGDGQDLAKADKFMQTFNELIGFADPVLQAKESLIRKSGKLEV